MVKRLEYDLDESIDQLAQQIIEHGTSNETKEFTAYIHNEITYRDTRKIGFNHKLIEFSISKHTNIEDIKEQLINKINLVTKEHSGHLLREIMTRYGETDELTEDSLVYPSNQRFINLFSDDLEGFEDFIKEYHRVEGSVESVMITEQDDPFYVNLEIDDLKPEVVDELRGLLYEYAENPYPYAYSIFGARFEEAGLHRSDVYDHCLFVFKRFQELCDGDEKPTQSKLRKEIDEVIREYATYIFNEKLMMRLEKDFINIHHILKTQTRGIVTTLD